MRVSALVAWIPGCRPEPKKTLLSEIAQPVVNYIKNNWDVILFYGAGSLSSISIMAICIGTAVHIAVKLMLSEKDRKNCSFSQPQVLALTAFLALNIARLRFGGYQGILVERGFTWITSLMIGFAQVPLKH